MDPLVAAQIAVAAVQDILFAIAVGMLATAHARHACHRLRSVFVAPGRGDERRAESALKLTAPKLPLVGGCNGSRWNGRRIERYSHSTRRLVQNRQ